jgi:surface polysaccharide O-acyltransferase-like enzyme
MIYIIFIPLALFEVFLNPEGLGMREFAGWGILTYLLIYICGYVIFSSADVRKAAEKLRFLALILALGCFSGRVYMDFAGLLTPFGTLNYTIFMVIRTFCMLSFLITIIGFANRGLQVNNVFLSYSNEAVLPFYMLHQSIIVAIGFFIINWGIHPIPKWLFLIVSSFVTIMIIYHFIIRPINPLRFLFGMKLRR